MHQFGRCRFGIRADVPRDPFLKRIDTNVDAARLEACATFLFVT
jgi:hypothetical protein